MPLRKHSSRSRSGTAGSATSSRNTPLSLTNAAASETGAARLVAACEHPYVHVIGHPTTRQIGRRPPIEPDWDAVFAAAGRTGTAMEVSSYPDRLDLNEELILRAKRHGVRFAVNTDSHSTVHLGHLPFGVGQAATWEPALSRAAAKIEQQAQKVKGKWVGRIRSARPLAAEEPAGPASATSPAPIPKIRMPRLLRTTRQTVRTLPVSEAARLLDTARDEVVVFREEVSGRVAVLYRSATGELTLVETEA